MKRSSLSGSVTKTLVFYMVFSLVFTPQSSLSQENITVSTEMPKSSLPEPGNITVNFKDVDVLTVLNYLSEISGVDIIPTPGVQGLVTMRLRDKPWEVALDIVTRNYGYAYSQEGEIIRVMPRSMLQTEDTVTEVLPLNHVIKKIQLVKEAAEGGDGDGSIAVEEEEEAIDQIMAAVNSILNKSRGEKATFISNANAIVVTAIPAKINEVKTMLEKIDRKPAQVLLEAKVIEIVLDDDEKLGIDWNAVVTASGAKRPVTFPFTRTGNLPFFPAYQNEFYPVGDNREVDYVFPQTPEEGSSKFPFVDDALGSSEVLADLFTMGTLDFSQFQAVLRMINDRSDTNILSTPRITTLNNQKATIKVVQKIMLQKTQESVQTADVITVEFEEDADAREIGVVLTVIPHVNESGDIVINLIPEVSSDLTFTELEVSGADNTVAMTYNTREANTQVRVKDGETIFIGGLIKDQVIDTSSRLPFLGDIFGDIPFLGRAFKYDGQEIDKTEIVFFITVHLVQDGLESIRKAYAVDYYNDNFPVEYQLDKEGTEEGSEGPEKDAVIDEKKDSGRLKKEQKKEHKPFLDFRKKK